MPNLLNTEGFIIFTTREFANRAGISLSAAAKRLSRLSDKEFLTRITKGVWGNTDHPYFHPLSCVHYLLGKEQGYVSFLTALHLHGVVSQIPKSMQVASTGRGRSLDSPIGLYEFFQIKPELMKQGTEWSETRLPYLIATPEKALLDTLYLATRKNRRFSRLPEVDVMQSGFRVKEFERLLEQLSIPTRILSAMRSQWMAIQK